MHSQRTMAVLLLVSTVSHLRHNFMVAADSADVLFELDVQWN